MAEELSCIVTLPNGSLVDILSEEGANQVLLSYPRFLRDKLNEIENLRANPNLHGRPDLWGDFFERHVFKALRWIGNVSIEADPRLFYEKMKKTDIKRWWNFAISQINEMEEHTCWIEEGHLHYSDTEIINICSLLLHHPLPVALAFKSNFFQALARLVRARQGNTNALPSNEVCYLIIEIVGTVFMETICESSLGFESWTREQALRALAKTGILEQFLRCSVKAKHEEEGLPSSLLELFDELQSHPRFLSEKLTVGTKCGDTLRAIVNDQNARDIFNGGDNSGESRAVARGLHAISYLADLTNAACNSCGTIESSESSLMKCSQCKIAWYCSRRCQRSDWNFHKQVCFPTDATELTALQRLVHNYFNKHRSVILQRMSEACETETLPANEMVIELDFIPHTDDTIPAIHDEQLSIDIAPIQAYVDGNRKPGFLEAFGQNPEMQQEAG